MSITFGRRAAVLAALVIGLLLAHAEARGQCKSGGGGPGRSLQGRQPGPPVGQLQLSTPQTQQLGTPLSVPVQTATPTTQPTLQTAEQQQRQLVASVTALQDLQDDPALTQARQKRLKATVTAALKKVEKQGDLLSSLQERQLNGRWTAADRQRLAALIAQQRSLAVSLEGQRTAADLAIALRALRANQPR